MLEDEPYRPTDFLPHLPNRAAEETSLGFQAPYRERHGMLRTGWRVPFHLGRHGDLSDAARRYDETLTALFDEEEGHVLRRCLQRLAGLRAARRGRSIPGGISTTPC